MMSIEKSALNKSCSSGSKLYSSWEHVLCCSLWSPQFFQRHLRFLLGTFFTETWPCSLSGCSSCPMLEWGWMSISVHMRRRLLKRLSGLSPVTIWFTLPSRQGASWIPFGWNKTEKCAPGACLMHSSCSWVLGPWASPTESPPTGVQPVRCSALRSPVCARSCGAAPLALAGTAFPSVQGAAGPHLDALHKVWIQSPLKSLNDFHWL